MEFKGFRWDSKRNHKGVDIGTEWNLKHEKRAMDNHGGQVDIGTEWNLKKENMLGDGDTKELI